MPAGYNVDRYRTRLGAGLVAFEAARAAVRRWEMFERGWLRVFPDAAEIREGSTVAVVAAHLGFYSINVSRIVYTLDEDGPLARFGFAYGTLGDHAESGEERFTVSWDRAGNAVWYDIVAFSRPRAVLARLGYPLGRALQKRFGRASLAAMARATSGTSYPTTTT